MAGTTWNPADKSANCLLSNGNLTAGISGASVNGVRSIDHHLLGKYYWECLWTTTGASDSIGIATASASLVGSATTVTPRCILNQNATIFLNGASAGNVGSVTSGSTICIAVDCTGQLIWFRTGAAGIWNNSAGNNPATGVGGVSIASQFSGQNVYAFTMINLSTGHVTADFGDSAFVGAVPSGFTAGFPAGADVVAATAGPRVSLLV